MKKNRVRKLVLNRETLRRLQVPAGAVAADNPSSTVCAACPDSEPSWCVICYPCTEDRCDYT